MQQSEIINLASQLFQGKLDKDGDGIDLADIQAALGQLVSNNEGTMDISSLLSNMNMGSLMSVAASWLGDGSNENISSNQVGEIFNEEQISAFSSQLGISNETALNGLTEALPAIVDKSSSGGSLLDSVGGLDGIMSMASKFFNK